MPRDNIVLQFRACKSRNYVTTNNKKTTPDLLEFIKFCRRCRKHTDHKETK
jgi:large subunit ribosomal protein L33